MQIQTGTPKQEEERKQTKQNPTQEINIKKCRNQCKTAEARK